MIPLLLHTSLELRIYSSKRKNRQILDNFQQQLSPFRSPEHQKMKHFSYLQRVKWAPCHECVWGLEVSSTILNLVPRSVSGLLCFSFKGMKRRCPLNMTLHRRQTGEKEYRTLRDCGKTKMTELYTSIISRPQTRYQSSLLLIKQTGVFTLHCRSNCAISLVNVCV